LGVYSDCESSCPCGADCPAGCIDCPDHPLCEDECEDAQINNEEYKTCLNAAVYQLDICLKSCSPEIGCHNSCYETYTEHLLTCPCVDQQTTTTTEVSTTTSDVSSDVFILVIPFHVDESYLQSGDGTSQISATINATENNYGQEAAFALVNGELHIFGGVSDGYKISRLDGCSFDELPARLHGKRKIGHAAVSTEKGQKALVCFGWDGESPRKSCEIFDGSSTIPTFATEWTHVYGALGLFNNQPATVGCWNAKNQKAETLSATGWTALPDHPLKLAYHSLVGLENGAMLLLGGFDYGSGSQQTGIWELQEEYWSRIGELSKPAWSGSAIYVSRSVYYFQIEDNFAIYRLDLDDNEELEAVERIGSQPGKNSGPVLIQTDSDYCT